jgi:calcium-dependent protein kinase
VVTKAT